MEDSAEKCNNDNPDCVWNTHYLGDKVNHFHSTV